MFVILLGGAARSVEFVREVYGIVDEIEHEYIITQNKRKCNRFAKKLQLKLLENCGIMVSVKDENQRQEPSSVIASLHQSRIAAS